MLVRLTLNGNTVTGEERLLQNLNERIRDVRQGPDGALWLLTDSSAGADIAGGAGCEVTGASPSATHAHLWKIKNAPAAMKAKPSA